MYKKISIVLSVIAFISVILFYLFNDIGVFTSSADLPEDTDTESSRAYVMPEGKALTYILFQSPKRLWISSKVQFSSIQSDTARHPYQFTVRVYGRDNSLLIEQQLELVAGVAEDVKLPGSEAVIPEYFLKDATLPLSPPKNIHLSLPEGASRVEVSMEKQSAEIKRVLLRAYQYVERSGRVKPIDSWQRLSDKQRENMLQNYPFGEEILTQEEIESLADFRWQPVIPEGDDGTDYDSELVYSVAGNTIQQKRHVLSQYEHQADVYKQVSFPIKNAGRYRLRGKHEFTKRSFKVFKTAYNLSDTLRQTQTFTFTEPSFSSVLELESGLVTFSSSIPVSLELFPLSGGAEEHDHFAQYIVLESDNAVAYSLLPDIENVASFQLRLRTFADQQKKSPQDAQAVVRVFAQQQVVAEYPVMANYEPDLNSQLAGEEFFTALSEPQLMHFAVPDHAERVEISARGPVLVALYTRLKDKPAYRVLPHQQRDWFDYPAGIADWFAIRPINYSDYVRSGGIRLIRNYHSSLYVERQQEEPDVAYQSILQDFARLTLNDLIVANPFPNQPVKRSENTALNFASLTEFPEITELDANQEPRNARLFFQKADNSPVQVQWRKDGVQQPPFWIAGKWGLVDANEVGKPLAGNVVMADSDVSWWRNHVPRQDAQWQQRRGALLRKNESISVRNTKQTEQEILSFVVYGTGQSDIVLDIALENVAFDKSVDHVKTLTQRRIRIQPQSEYTGFQLSGKRTLSSRQSFSILLDSDIKPSSHNINITLSEGEDVYLSIVKRGLRPAPVVRRFRTTEAQ